MKPLVSLALLLCSAFALAQTAVDIAADPHYHALIENECRGGKPQCQGRAENVAQVRVLAVTFGPNEKAYVRYEHNYLVVTLRDCGLVLWREGSSPIQNFRFSQGEVRFSLGGQVEGIRNDRSAECRNITVEFLNPKVTNYSYQTEAGWSSSEGAISAPTDPHIKFVDGINLGAS